MSTSALIIVICVIVLVILIIVAVSIIGYQRSKAKKEAKEAESEEEEGEREKEKAGAAGEDAVSAALGEQKRGRKYIYRDYILDGKNFTHEMDFLVVTRAGVFVLEVKNWGGTTYGNLGDDEWKQLSGPDGDKVTMHQNPFKQNESHVKAVSAIVPSFVQIYSYVVFANGTVEGDAESKIFTPDTIGAEIDSKEDVLSAQDTQTLALTIAGERSSATREEHIENVKKNSKK